MAQVTLTPSEGQPRLAEPRLPPDFRLGVLAPEYPPLVGGMPTLAQDLVASLSELVDVALFTNRGLGTKEPKAPEYDVLSRDPWKNRRILQQTEVDSWLALNAGLIPLARCLQRPFFAYVHGNDFLRPWIACGPRWFETLRKPYAAAIRHALRRRAIELTSDLPRLVFCNSRRTAKLLEEQARVSHRRIRILPPGVHESFFSVKRTESSGGLRILTVAKLSQRVARKNIEGVIRALALLADSVDLTYTVVGDGDDRPRLEELAEDLNLGARVDFRGGIDQNELLKCYSEADLFILASKASPGDVEGFGIVYIEASAAGVPVICSREGGAIDAVEEGVNGLVIQDSTPGSIARGIEDYIRLRESFEETRIRQFADGFRWNNLVPQLLREIAAAT